jgi:hypothetical protein
MSEVNGAVSVKTTDVMSIAYEAAMTRVNECIVSATLIDNISKADWANWDAFGENPMVSDPDGISGEDTDDSTDLLAA